MVACVDAVVADIVVVSQVVCIAAVVVEVVPVLEDAVVVVFVDALVVVVVVVNVVFVRCRGLYAVVFLVAVFHCIGRAAVRMHCCFAVVYVVYRPVVNVRPPSDDVGRGWVMR